MSVATGSPRINLPVAATEPPAASRPQRIATAVGVGVAVAAFSVASAMRLEIAVLAVLLLLGVFVISLLALSRRDTGSVLTLAVLLLFLLPQPYVLVGPLRSVGNPAQLVGLAALAMWMAGRLTGLIHAVPLHPIRWVLLLFAVTGLTSYAAGMNRILSVEEAAGAARSLFPLIAAIGIGILAVDGLRDRVQVAQLLQRLVWVAGIEAFAGIVEFLFKGFSYRDFMLLPGLTTTTELISDTRSGFDRLQAAASHPIEYAVTLAALVPLAVHFTVYASTAWQRRLSGLALVLILAVIPMTVARSGILAVVVGMAFYAVHLTGRARLNLLVVGLIGIGAYQVLVPGLLGTLRALLLVGEKDPSIAGRTEDYAKIPGLLSGFELFGRGLGTFDPLEYFFLDNQYLGQLLEGGVVALLTLILLFLVGIGVSRGIRHHSGEPSMRSLGQALAGSIAAFAVTAATFDELGFRQATFALFLLLGCAGALWSTVRDQPKHLRSGSLRLSGEGAGVRPIPEPGSGPAVNMSGAGKPSIHQAGRI